jgi:hypothetical protein
MNVLDHKILESWMSSQDPEVSKLPEDFDRLGLSSFTHIATDGKTLHWLMKYTQEAVHGWGILYLDKNIGRSFDGSFSSWFGRSHSFSVPKDS